MLDDNLRWLVKWYNAQCDAVWEKTHSISIVNIGNPGWGIRIDIEKTDLQYKNFKKVSIDRTENNWLFCWIENGFFDCACGTLNISEGLKTFRKWTERTFQNDKDFVVDDDFFWLVNWFDSQCDGYWEGSNRIQIKTNENAIWSISIRIEETELEDKHFEDISIKRTETDWLTCKLENGFFEGSCSTLNVPEVFQAFRNWAES